MKRILNRLCPHIDAAAIFMGVWALALISHAAGTPARATLTSTLTFSVGIFMANTLINRPGHGAANCKGGSEVQKLFIELITLGLAIALVYHAVVN